MSDPIIGDADLLFNQAVAEAESYHHETAAALSGDAAEAYLVVGNDGAAALALRTRGGQLYAVGDCAEAAAVYARAAALAGRSQDARLRLSCLWGRADSLAAVGEWAAVRDLCGEAVPSMREYGYDDFLGEMLLLRARAEYWLDFEVEALASTAEATAAFRERGEIRGQLAAEDFAVTLLAFLERHEDAQRTARRNVEIARLTSDPAAVLYHRRRLGEALLASGGAAQAVAQFEQAREGYRADGRPGAAGVAATWLGRALAQLHRHAEAADALRSAVAVLEAAGPRWEWERDEARSDLAVALHGLGDLEGAIETDRAVLAGRASAGRPLRESDAALLERLTLDLVRRGRASELALVLQELADAGLLGDGCPAAIDYTARACGVWAFSQDGDPQTALKEAMALLDHPGLSRESLAEAWLLQIAGTAAQPQDPAGLARLARAHAIHLVHGDFDALLQVSGVILQRTASA